MEKNFKVIIDNNTKIDVMCMGCGHLLEIIIRDDLNSNRILAQLCNPCKVKNYQKGFAEAHVNRSKK